MRKKEDKGDVMMENERSFKTLTLLPRPPPRHLPGPCAPPPIPLPALWDRLADTSPLGAFPLARVQERPGLSRFLSSSSAKTRLDSKVPFQPPVLELL